MGCSHRHIAVIEKVHSRKFRKFFRNRIFFLVILKDIKNLADYRCVVEINEKFVHAVPVDIRNRKLVIAPYGGLIPIVHIELLTVWKNAVIEHVLHRFLIFRMAGDLVHLHLCAARFDIFVVIAVSACGKCRQKCQCCGKCKYFFEHVFSSHCKIPLV